MCCVMGYTGHDLSAAKFKEYLLRTVMRGPDDQRVVEGPFGLMGFGRLAIMGLTPEILWREKAAFSDAVGHSMVDDIKEYTNSLYTDEEFQLRRANYSAHCMPFTKESLFYREIFEKYYHDQSRTIVDFWMPNKAWPGCNVNDPSARVLANYGASGV